MGYDFPKLIITKNHRQFQPSVLGFSNLQIGGFKIAVCNTLSKGICCNSNQDLYHFFTFVVIYGKSKDFVTFLAFTFTVEVVSQLLADLNHTTIYCSPYHLQILQHGNSSTRKSLAFVSTQLNMVGRHNYNRARLFQQHIGWSVSCSSKRLKSFGAILVSRSTIGCTGKGIFHYNPPFPQLDTFLLSKIQPSIYIYAYMHICMLRLSLIMTYVSLGDLPSTQNQCYGTR